MKLGIDARMLGPLVGGGGLGRYVEELVRELGKLDHGNRRVVFLGNREQGTGIRERGWEVKMADAHWYTLKEQLVLPGVIDREGLDLVLFPHWNVPIFLRTPFVVVIHDLILLEAPRSAKATTRSPLVFVLKRLGYRLVLRYALRRSRAIIAVSQYTKEAIGRFFPEVPLEKVKVVYEGVTRLAPSPPTPPLPPPLTPSSTVSSESNDPRAGGGFPSGRGETEPYLLYVGNAYPHKNLEMLLAAFEKLRAFHPTLTLELAGRGDVFYKRLQEKVRTMGLESCVHFTMDATDAQLATLYRLAALYVFPSRNEGFGLPPLEAMSIGVPVVSSKAGSLPEILGEATVYFDPRDLDEMVATIDRGLRDHELRQSLIQKGHEQVKKYSWGRMAREIYEVLENATQTPSNSLFDRELRVERPLAGGGPKGHAD